MEAFSVHLKSLHEFLDRCRTKSKNLLDTLEDEMARVGYRRVSSWEQRSDRQLEGVELDEVFEDWASGKDLNRPQWEAAAKYLRRGDVLLVHSMDRLARNLGDLLATVQGLNERGVEVRFVRENLNFEPGAGTNPMAKLMLSMLGAVAEFERSLILERQREGIALARQRGAYAGRKRALSDDQVEAARQRLGAGEKIARIARELGVSRQTVYSQVLKRTEHAPSVKVGSV